jgi:ABC-type amino acid transport substrate-binding protein
MFARKIGLLAAAIASLLPALAQGEEADTALTRIRQKKAVTIGFRESAAPFSYLDERKQASGYSIDICNRIALEIGGVAQRRNRQGLFSRRRLLRGLPNSARSRDIRAGVVRLRRASPPIEGYSRCSGR